LWSYDLLVLVHGCILVRLSKIPVLDWFIRVGIGMGVRVWAGLEYLVWIMFVCWRVPEGQFKVKQYYHPWQTQRPGKSGMIRSIGRVWVCFLFIKLLMTRVHWAMSSAIILQTQ
jgi:hypothetical protein